MTPIYHDENEQSHELIPPPSFLAVLILGDNERTVVHRRFAHGRLGDRGCADYGFASTTLSRSDGTIPERLRITPAPPRERMQATPKNKGGTAQPVNDSAARNTSGAVQSAGNATPDNTYR